MPKELPIKSKFLVFEQDDDGIVYLYNKHFNELVGTITINRHFVPEKNTAWTERDLRDILKAIELMKRGKKDALNSTPGKI